jgi:CheY-like chemotaxis protein
MTDELFSLQVAVVSESRGDYELFRQAASESKFPIDIIEAESAGSANQSVGGDLIFLDKALGDDKIARVAAAARAAAKPPFTVLLAASGPATEFQTDAVATKPSELEEAKHLLNRSIRVRLPSRVMVVDDSSTMRSIVRKILAATRFPLEVTEVEQGGKAIELAREAEFDIVFLDYNMPGFSGLETITEFRRLKRRPTFVLMTTMPDETVAARARAQDATFLKKPFFPADIERLLCGFYGLRALNPQRA